MELQLHLTGIGTWDLLKGRGEIGQLACNGQHVVQVVVGKNDALSPEEKAELDKLIRGLQYSHG